MGENVVHSQEFLKFFGALFHRHMRMSSHVTITAERAGMTLADMSQFMPKTYEYSYAEVSGCPKKAARSPERLDHTW